MIEAKDLRIGNYYDFYYVDQNNDNIIDRHESVLDKDDLLSFLQTGSPRFEGIPITEEKLIEFGFERKVGREGYKWLYNGFELGHLTNGFFIQFGIDQTDSFKPKYIHQLQNLFYCLTGQELTKKRITMEELKLIELTPNNIPERQVIAIDKDGKCDIGKIKALNNIFYMETATKLLCEITHYMHIPKIH